MSDINNPKNIKKFTEEQTMYNNGNEKSTRQILKNVALAACVPTNYQRGTDDAQVADIVNGFDEARLGALTVSLRDGNYHIVDGLHRSKAMKALGYTHALCIVLTGMTYEQEAEYFRKQNENKRIISTFDDFKAGLESKNETCMKIDKIVRANDFQVGRGGFFKIAAIRALFTIVEDYGFDVLDDTLCLIAATWNGIAKASQIESLLGVAEFVHRYGMVEFSERLRDKFTVIWYEYSESMRVRGSVGSNASRKKFCRALVEYYNKGLGSKSKKRLVWEE